MYKALFIMLSAACVLCACKSSGPSSKAQPAATASASNSNANDAVAKKLVEIAGGGATDCGRLSSQATADLEAASKCATQAAQQKHPFYVAYDMPGMTVAVVENTDGKLFSVQSQAGGEGVVSEPCPAELRVAPSGRVTCYAPGTFPMGAGSGSHGSMSMPSGMANPHQQSRGGQKNPHQSGAQKPPQ
ncbi:MAG: hypothetical protein ACRD3Q_18970 [Terriglobales bacterium]